MIFVENQTRPRHRLRFHANLVVCVNFSSSQEKIATKENKIKGVRQEHEICSYIIHSFLLKFNKCELLCQTEII